MKAAAVRRFLDPARVGPAPQHALLMRRQQRDVVGREQCVRRAAPLLVQRARPRRAGECAWQRAPPLRRQPLRDRGGARTRQNGRLGAEWREHLGEDASQRLLVIVGDEASEIEQIRR